MPSWAKWGPSGVAEVLAAKAVETAKNGLYSNDGIGVAEVLAAKAVETNWRFV